MHSFSTLPELYVCLTLQNQQELFQFLYFYSTDNHTRLGRDKLIYGLIIINS